MDGHDQLRVFALHELNEKRVVWIAGNDDSFAILAFCQCGFLLIEAEWLAFTIRKGATWFAAARIWSVAVIARFREDRLDVFVE